MPVPAVIDPVEQSPLWKRGVSLDDAWWRFGTDQQRERYNSVAPAEFPEPLDQASIAELSGVKMVQAVASLLSEAMRPSLDQSGISHEMQKHVAALLQAGKLVGYGYHYPRQASDNPRRIPDDLFDVSFIEWDKSEIDGNGSRYFAVRVFKANWLAKGFVPAAITATISPKARPPGRPSMRVTVLSAFEYLISNGSISGTELKKSIAEKIRTQIRSESPTPNSLANIPSEKTILKYLSQIRLPAPKL